MNVQTDRYRDWQDRLDLVICRDCSTKTRLALIPRDEINEHDQWHAEEDIPVVPIRQTRTVTVKLAGATHYWLQDNTSWGNLPHETQTSKDARAKVMAADGRKVGKGSVYTVDLTDEEAESLWGILDSIAGAGESMSSEERGSDDYAYRVIRRDAERIRESLKAIGWTWVKGEWIFEDAVPPVVS